MPHRRNVVFALGASMLSAPMSVFAQQPPKVARIGFISQRGRPASIDADMYGAFLRGMRELGYIKGKTLLIEWRFAGGRADALPGYANELVKLNVDVIVTTGTQTTAAVQKATTSIPIVMGAIIDPIANGFIASLSRPGGNITGLATLTTDVSSKYLELLRGFLPNLARVAVLMISSNTSHATILKSVQASGQKMGIAVLPFEGATLREIEESFPKMTREKVGAVIVAPDNFFNQHWRQAADLALKHQLPSITAPREYVESGGLISYGRNLAESWHRAATYVDKILKGAKPADLPVELPTRFELFVNSRTAKALSLTIPQSVLISADKVIE